MGWLGDMVTPWGHQAAFLGDDMAVIGMYFIKLCSILSICMYMYVYLCIFMYIYVYLCIFMYIYVYLCIVMYIYVYLCIFMYIYVYLCIFMYIYVYLCIFMYIYIMMTIYSHNETWHQDHIIHQHYRVVVMVSWQTHTSHHLVMADGWTSMLCWWCYPCTPVLTHTCLFVWICKGMY